jgi:signal recognition particle GTPase
VPSRCPRRAGGYWGRFGEVLKGLRGQARLTEDNIKDTLREVRMALLEADVALPVVRGFVERVRERRWAPRSRRA